MSDIKKDHSIGAGTGAVAGAMTGAAVGSAAGPVAAIDALTAVQVPDDSRPLRTRKATLLADAYEAAGRKADAAAALDAVLKVFPNARLQQRLESLRR